jgi:hypothetical protein
VRVKDFNRENNMIEIKGWLSISSSENDEIDIITNNINNIKELIKPFIRTNQFFELKDLNGEYTLFIGIDHNHNIGHDKDVYELMKKIGSIAKDSYGLVHLRFHDDEENNNKFFIYKLAKGMVTIEKDELLSPCEPIIE